MPDLSKILSAPRSLTLAGVPTGFLPVLLADLARGAKGDLVYIAPDEAAMRAIATTAPFFAPDLSVLQFPVSMAIPSTATARCRSENNAARCTPMPNPARRPSAA